MTIRVLTALLDQAFDEAVVRRLTRADAGASVVRRSVDAVALRSAVGSGIADVVVVDAELRGLSSDMVAELHARGTRVVVVSGDVDVVRGLGADAAVLPDVESVVTALRGGVAADQPSLAGADRESGGRIVAVWGPVGAPGRTTVATGVADELPRLGVGTMLVDVDTYGPSVATQLGLLEDSSGVAAACRIASAGKMDAEALRRVSVMLPSGLSVLTGIADPQGWDELRPAALDATLQATREVSAVTMVDIGFCIEHDPLAWFEPGTPTRNQAAVATLGAADIVLAVGGSDPVALARFIRSLPDVRSLAPTAVVHVVLNGLPRGREREREASELLRRHLDCEPTMCLPFDASACADQRMAGRTLAEVAPRSALRQRMRELAGVIAGVSVPKGRRRAA